MSQLAIKAENISKQYRLGKVGTGTLSHDLNRLWYKVRGLEDPYVKIGEANDRSMKGESDYVWSLQELISARAERSADKVQDVMDTLNPLYEAWVDLSDKV